MPPSHLLALLPPPDLTARIQGFRRAHDLQDAAAVPHVTVKARSGLTPDLAWEENLRGVVARQPPILLELGGPRLFGNGSALYLVASGAGAITLHLALLEALRNTLRAARFFGYEGPELNLHLSLALARRGMDLPELLAAAQTEFSDLERRPLRFTARTVTLMRKPGPGGIYAPLEDWPLLGRSQGGAESESEA